MFERLMQAAERAATGVSRRQFFGSVGRAAAVVAAAAAGMAGSAAAGPPNQTCPPYPTSTQNCSGSSGYSVGSSCYIDAYSGSGTCVQASGGGCYCYKKKPGHGR